MDSVDFAVYRFLSPDGEARFWAGRRVIDPMMPAREIAARTRLSENAVRARLRGLAERGYLRTSAVTPNPSLFDARAFVTEIPVRTSVDSDRLFEDLALVDGVVFARDTMDEGERKVRVHFLAERDAATARTVSLLGRLCSAPTPPTATPYLLPPCEIELSPLDWRILAARMRLPDADLGELAKSVHVSDKTTARRHHRLAAARAFWWTHGPESEEFPLALVRVRVRDASHRASVTKLVIQKFEEWMPAAADGLGLPAEEASILVAGLTPADSPTFLERVVRGLTAVPGVVDVQRTFPLGSRAYPAWLADRVAERVPSPR
jgi:DNA-binding Lrp family transcriptional regulator